MHHDNIMISIMITVMRSIMMSFMMRIMLRVVISIMMRIKISFLSIMISTDLPLRRSRDDTADPDI